MPSWESPINWESPVNWETLGDGSMALITTNQITQAGIAHNGVPVAASAGGDTVLPGDRAFLYVKNAGVGSIDVSIDDPRSATPTAATAFNPDAKVTVPTGGERLIGPLSASRFADPVTGLVSIAYSGVTSVTVAAYSI